LRQLNATKEIILSAGCIGSPHILLNSGIGKPEDLRAVGVDPLVNLPDVGANFSDHPVVSTSWLVNSTDTFEMVRQNAESDLDLWKNNRTGPYTVSVTSHVIFGRVSNVTLPSPDPAAGPASPHFELAIIVSIHRLFNLTSIDVV
jgi:choline dehydrogenase-like flavoprotein